MSDNGKELCWKDPGAVKSKSKIKVKDIEDIKDGWESDKFKKKTKKPSEAQEKLAFSIESGSKKKSLALLSANIEDK